MSEHFKKFDFNIVESPRYKMVPVELKDFIDWDVKRVYYITKPQEDTGTHCHFEEKELFILQQGTCTAVIDYGNGIEEIPMTGPNQAIYVANYVWHGFKDFSDDGLLLALSSTNYKASRDDYEEDYDKYLEFRDEKLGIDSEK